MRCSATIILLLLAVAGCRMEQQDDYQAALKSYQADSSRVANAPKDAAAEVAAVMAANDITLPQVVAFLYAYGFDVVNRSSTLRPHWSPAPPGRDAQGNTVPVAYYVANIRIAVGDTTLAIYAPQAVGPVWMRVKAYDGRGMSGVWSVDEVSGSGDLLPGVSE